MLETLVDLDSTREYRDIFTKMQTLLLTIKEVAVLKRGFNAQVQRLHTSLQPVYKEEKVEEVIPDVIVGPNNNITWLHQVGKDTSLPSVKDTLRSKSEGVGSVRS